MEGKSKNPHAISRRTLFKLVVPAAAATVATLAGCAPAGPDVDVNYVIINSGVDTEKELSNVKALNEKAWELRNTYGFTVLNRMPACVKELSKSYDRYADSGQLEPNIEPSNWGKQIENADEVINSHLENVLFNNIFMLPAPEDRPDYIPPDKSEVINLYRKIRKTFPALTMTIDNIYVAPWQRGGGLYVKQGHYNERLKTQINSNSIVMCDPRNNEENNVVSNTHELHHGEEENYQAIMPVMTLSNYSQIPLGLVTYSAEIAKEYFNLDEADGTYKKYGLAFHKFLDNYDEWSLNLDFASRIPSEMGILDTDDEQTVKSKKTDQLRFMMKKVGKSLLDGSTEFTDTSEKRVSAESMMAGFFWEASHYLVGPYQVGAGQIPGSYDGLGLTGIHKFNLEMHKIRMAVFANPELGGDPARIRESLGLEVGVDSLTKFGAIYMGTLNTSDNKVWKVHQLPNNGNNTVYYVSDPDGLGHLIQRETNGLDMPTIMDIAFTDGSYGGIKEMEIPFQISEVNINMLAELSQGENIPVVGIVNSDKIQFETEEKVTNPGNFIYYYDQDTHKTRLYINTNQINPTKALIFTGEGLEETYNKTLMVAAGDQSPNTLEEILPHLTDTNISMRILDLRDHGNSTVTVGDIDGFGPNGRFILEMDEDTKRQIASYQMANPATKVSIVSEVGLNPNSNATELSFKLNVYPNTPNMKAVQSFDIQRLRVIRDGNYDN